MTQLLERAFNEASRLSKIEQNVVGRWLLAELTSQRRWDAMLAESENLLEQMADEALEEDRQGKTQLLNPDEL